MMKRLETKLESKDEYTPLFEREDFEPILAQYLLLMFLLKLKELKVLREQSDISLYGTDEPYQLDIENLPSLNSYIGLWSTPLIKNVELNSSPNLLTDLNEEISKYPYNIGAHLQRALVLRNSDPSQALKDVETAFAISLRTPENKINCVFMESCLDVKNKAFAVNYRPNFVQEVGKVLLNRLIGVSAFSNTPTLRFEKEHLEKIDKGLLEKAGAFYIDSLRTGQAKKADLGLVCLLLQRTFSSIYEEYLNKNGCGIHPFNLGKKQDLNYCKAINEDIEIRLPWDSIKKCLSPCSLEKPSVSIFREDFFVLFLALKRLEPRKYAHLNEDINCFYFLSELQKFRVDLEILTHFKKHGVFRCATESKEMGSDFLNMKLEEIINIHSTDSVISRYYSVLSIYSNTPLNRLDLPEIKTESKASYDQSKPVILTAIRDILLEINTGAFKVDKYVCLEKIDVYLKANPFLLSEQGRQVWNAW